MELDDFLMARTVCKVLDVDPTLAHLTSALEGLDNTAIKVVRTLGADTQSIRWRNCDVILVDVTTVEYASNLFDLMMSTTAPLPDRQRAMDKLLYKQWARSLFISGYSVPSWLVFTQNGSSGRDISYRDDGTNVSSYVQPNVRHIWRDLFSAFIFGHELAHVLLRRKRLDEGPYAHFLAELVRDDVAQQPSLEDFVENQGKLINNLDKDIPAHWAITEKEAFVERVKSISSDAQHDKALSALHIQGSLFVELICDLYACELLMRTYDFSNDVFSYSTCYVLPICVEVINFLKIGIANRLWAESVWREYSTLRDQYSPAEISQRMTAFVEDSYDAETGRIHSEDNLTRMLAISKFMVDTVNQMRTTSETRTTPTLLDQGAIWAKFMTTVWISYQHLYMTALENTDTQWLERVFSVAERVEEASNQKRLNGVDIGMPGVNPLSFVELERTVREKFVQENGL